MTKKKFYGVGYRLNCGHSSHPRAYFLWQGMLKRCYDPKHIRFHLYGGAGVSVCKRWLCLDNFVEDMSKIEGWDKNAFENKLLTLDKDIKQLGKKNKVYSVKTCLWVSSKNNSTVQDSQMKKFRAISADGKKFIGYNKAAFCREHGLNPASVAKCLSGRAKSLHGWTFEYLS